MKNYIKIFVVIISVALMTVACEMERVPYDSIEEAEVFSTEAGLQTATYGNYAYLKGQGVDDNYSWYNNWHRICEYPGDNVSLSGTTTDALFYSYTYNNIDDGYRTREVWRASYKVIVACNKVIENAPEGASAEMDQLIGENYYMRGLLYFQLTNIFGRPYSQGTENLGVPIKLDSDRDNLPARNTVGEVYTQVLADLTKAGTLMSYATDKGNVYGSKGAADALLARVHLYMENDALAVSVATSVIDDGPYEMLSTEDFSKYPTFAPEANSETIFALKSLKDKDYTHGWYAVGGMYANVDGAGWGEMYASKPYMDLVNQNPEDVRSDFIEPVYAFDDNGEFEYWAMYVNDDYLYVLIDVEMDDISSQWEYDDDGTATLVDEEMGTGGETLYSIDVDGTKTFVEIMPRMATRRGYPKWYIIKCSGQEGQAQLWSPVISRLAEMYLIRAEANAKLTGHDQEVLDDINVIRERAGLSGSALWTTGTVAAAGKTIFDVVMEERQLELAWEGHRKFDVFRNGLTMDRRYPGTHTLGANPYLTIGPDDARVVEFIPESERLAQPNLIQNPVK